MREKITGVLSGLRIFRDYSKAFTEITGLPLSLRPLDAATGRGRWSGALLGRPKCACKSCAKGFVRVVGDIPSSAALVKCTNGCCGAAVPVRSGREVIALLQVGPVRGDVRLRRLVVILRSSPRQCRAAMKLLGIFAEQLSSLCNQIVVQKQNGETPVVTRAKEYVARRYAENISSRHAAKDLRLSRFYFCKLFKKGAGLTFTEYLARVRVEHVKGMLLNPNLRVSEIAFQTGFQSLTHFNRVFLKLTRRSPTEYREALLVA